MEQLFKYSLIFIGFSMADANFEIVGSGVVPLRRGDVGMVFYVTAKNSCNQRYQVTGNMVKCSETITGEDPDTTTVTLVGGNMGQLQANETRNLSYIFPNLYPYNRAGECQLAVWYGDDEHPPKELRVTVPFDTLLMGKSIPMLLRGFVSMKDVHRCKTMDEDPLEKCMPVNCPVKYSGHRNFFNHRLRRCQPVPMCLADPTKEMPDITYSPISNTCQNAEITEEDIRYLTGSEGKCEDQMKSEPMPHIKNIRCHNGHLDAATGFCVCDNGWGSPPLDVDQFHPSNMLYHMCTIRMQTWTSIYDHQVQARYVVIAILGVILTMLMVCCAFCVLSVWEYYVETDPCDCTDVYDMDGYKLFRKEFRAHPDDAVSDTGANVCLCDADDATSNPPCDFHEATVCTNSRRNQSGRDYESSVEGDDDEEDEVDDDGDGSPDEEDGADVESMHSDRMALQLRSESRPIRAVSSRGSEAMRRRELLASVPSVFRCDANARFISSTDDEAGGVVARSVRGGRARGRGVRISAPNSSATPRTPRTRGSRDRDEPREQEYVIGGL